MKIAIEVQGGCVVGVYSGMADACEVFVVDNDAAKVGENALSRLEVQPISEASEAVKIALL